MERSTERMTIDHVLDTVLPVPPSQTTPQLAFPTLPEVWDGEPLGIECRCTIQSPVKDSRRISRPTRVLKTRSIRRHKAELSLPKPFRGFFALTQTTDPRWLCVCPLLPFTSICVRICLDPACAQYKDVALSKLYVAFLRDGFDVRERDPVASKRVVGDVVLLGMGCVVDEHCSPGYALRSPRYRELGQRSSCGTWGLETNLLRR
jgi:hypothetical protein